MKLSYLLNEAIRLHSDKLPFKDKNEFYNMCEEYIHCPEDDIVNHKSLDFINYLLMKAKNIFLNKIKDKIKVSEMRESHQLNLYDIKLDGKRCLYVDISIFDICCEDIHNIKRLFNIMNLALYCYYAALFESCLENEKFIKEITFWDLPTFNQFTKITNNRYTRPYNGIKNDLIPIFIDDFKLNEYEYIIYGLYFPDLDEYRKLYYDYIYSNEKALKQFLKYLLSKAGITMVNPYK